MGYNPNSCPYLVYKIHAFLSYNEDAARPIILCICIYIFIHSHVLLCSNNNNIITISNNHQHICNWYSYHSGSPKKAAVKLTTKQTNNTSSIMGHQLAYRRCLYHHHTLKGDIAYHCFFYKSVRIIPHIRTWFCCRGGCNRRHLI